MRKGEEEVEIITSWILLLIFGLLFLSIVVSE